MRAALYVDGGRDCTSGPRSDDKGHVFGLLWDRDGIARLIEALRGHAAVTVYRCSEALLHALRCRRPVCVLVQLRSPDGVAVLPLLKAVREGFPSVTLVAYCSLNSGATRDILEAVRLGVDGLVLRGYDDTGVVLRNALRVAEHRRGSTTAIGELQPLLPPPVLRVLTHCLSSVHDGLSVDRIARSLGVHRRTLVKQFAGSHLTPRQIIGWARLIVAGRLLEDRFRPVDAVARDVDLADGTALRNLLMRYTALRPRDVRHGGGAQCVLGALSTQLRARAGVPGSSCSSDIARARVPSFDVATVES